MFFKKIGFWIKALTKVFRIGISKISIQELIFVAFEKIKTKLNSLLKNLGQGFNILQRSD